MKKVLFFMFVAHHNIYSMGEAVCEFASLAREGRVSIKEELESKEVELGRLNTAVRLFDFLRKVEDFDAAPYKYLMAYDYLIDSLQPFAKYGDVKNKIVNNLLKILNKISDTDVRSGVLWRFVKLFQGQSPFLQDAKSTFATYAMLAYASTADSLSMYDVNLINDLSQNVSGELKNVIQDIIKKAPFLVGAYFDVRPENDALKLDDIFKKKILTILQGSLEESESLGEVENAFIKIVKAIG